MNAIGSLKNLCLGELVPRDCASKLKPLQGSLTSQTVKELPPDLQEYGKKLTESDFPFEATVTNDGVVTIGGTVEYVGERLTLADLLNRKI